MGLGPGLGPCRAQTEAHAGPRPGPMEGPCWAHAGSQALLHILVPRTVSYPGLRDCLIPWSQGLPHTLVPSTASFSGPRWTLCRVPGGPYVRSKKSEFQNWPIWAPMNFRVHMDPERVSMEAEDRPNGGLGAKPPEKQNLVTWSRWNCHIQGRNMSLRGPSLR